MRPSDVAEALESAAERHREAIAYWTAVGDEDRAALERRSAEVADLTARIERDRAALEECRAAT